MFFVTLVPTYATFRVTSLCIMPKKNHYFCVFMCLLSWNITRWLATMYRKILYCNKSNNLEYDLKNFNVQVIFLLLRFLGVGLEIACLIKMQQFLIPCKVNFQHQHHLYNFNVQYATHSCKFSKKICFFSCGFLMYIIKDLFPFYSSLLLTIYVT